MHHPDKQYYQLAEKWLNGTITEEEKKQFSEWYNAQQDMPLSISSTFAPDEEALRRRILHHIVEQKSRSAKVVLMGRKLVFKIGAAAFILLCCGVSVYYWASAINKQRSAVAKAPLQDVAPGGNKAVLILGDGSRIVLDTAGKGTIATQQSTQIIKLNNGQLAYQPSRQQKETIYNTLATPRGGQYAIVLADGTKVWLNAASSIRFPTAFNNKERAVDITGEVYFEVTPQHIKNKGKVPFIVNVHTASGMAYQVEVSGTRFNINAYDNEADIKTTLVEGKVKVNAATSVSLMPAQEAVFYKTGRQLQVQPADVEQTIAWTVGMFEFHDATLRSIMRQLSRWYDVEVQFSNPISNELYNGSIRRQSTLSQVLQILKATGVSYTLKGRTVVIESH